MKEETAFRGLYCFIHEAHFYFLHHLGPHSLFDLFLILTHKLLNGTKSSIPLFKQNDSAEHIIYVNFFFVELYIRKQPRKRFLFFFCSFKNIFCYLKGKF